ncbi:CBM96 family carbohydrate-binding protein [Sediminicola sp. 1XM1-17]|uniref:CBM96 family carbohydrate-binding protein n=1 Tax=Sediminicola sp. 1XM1-17 TaxID=3127702 RepID=UPI0030779D37
MILLLFVVFFQISCEKDTDLLTEAILLPENPAEIEDASGKDSLVSKTIELSPINDAYVQEGKGYDDQIIRIQTNIRTSYLMFDLSSIDGELENIELKLTVDSDDGDGTLKIFKGAHNEWSENKLSSTTAPSKEIEITTVSKAFNTGVTETIAINKDLISKELISFVLEQQNGNDFSITSKENSNKMGPKLAVTYRTTKGEPQEEEANPNDSQTSSTEPFAYELKAFPTAEGFGKNATGGRGGKVIHVTNLNDNGPGSLRDAVEQTGKRTIVFDVGGEIVLNSTIRIAYNQGDVTIAGQTAPSPGISIRDYPLEVNGSNVILRYLTIRLGDVSLKEQGYEWDAFRIAHRNSPSGYNIENVIVDHCSFSWATDENVSFDGDSDTKKTQNITIQNCMINEPAESSSYNMLVGNYVYNLSIYRNYFSHAKDRSPLIGYGIANETVEVIGNLIYGFKYGANIAWGNHVDFLGNHYRPFSNILNVSNVVGYGANSTNNPDAKETNGGIYAANNTTSNSIQYSFLDPRITKYNKSSRILSNSTISYWPKNKTENEDFVFGINVGNSLYRDAVDTRLLNDYKNNTGSFRNGNNPSTYPGGWPIKKSTSRSDDYDKDNDGMADSWEIATFGELSKTAAGKDLNTDYTNLEVFLHSLLQ